MMQAFVIISAFILLAYAATIFSVARCLPLHTRTYVARDMPGISIIIPCRNEAENINACLQSVAANGLLTGKSEVIVVDDHSDDATATEAAKMKDLLPLRILKSEGEGKKAALETGIRHAKNDAILTLDADCTVHTNWLESMTSEFIGRKLNMLCGPLILQHDKNLFSALQCAESAAIVGLSAAMLESGRPATCNGANLMFSKRVFEKAGSYHEHRHIASGDDDLLMHRFYKLDPAATGYTLNPQSAVTAPTAETREAFYAQRLRWISKRSAYLFPWNQYMQWLITLHLAAFYFLLLTSVIVYMPVNLLFILIKYAADLYYRQRLTSFVQVPVLHLLLMPIYQSYIFSLLWKSLYHIPEWKGRKIN